MGYLRAFFDNHIRKGAAAPQKHTSGLLVDDDGRKYATGLRMDDDDQPNGKYATGVDLPNGKQPQKYATGLSLPEDEELAKKYAGRGPLGLSASVGKGGKNNPDDVLKIQIALNKRVKAGLPENGTWNSKVQKAIEDFQKLLGQFKPGGVIEPGRGPVRALASSAKLPPPPEPPKPIAPPKLGPPTLVKAPAVWRGTRDILKTNIAELKKGVLAHYGAEYPELLKEIDETLKKLGVILEKLDNRLSDSLDKANAAKDDGERKAELKYAKTLLAGYIQYVKTDTMIAHVDANPFGVTTNLRQVLIDALTHLAKAIG